MTLFPSSRIVRYGFALLAVTVAVVLRWILTPVWGERLPFITFFAAILLAAWYGGAGPGLLALLLSVCLSSYLWLGPTHSWRITQPADWLAIGIFIGVSLLIVLITETMHRARRAAEQAQQDLAAQSARYQRIVETANEGIWQIDYKTCLTYVNQQLAEMLGYSPDEILGRSSFDFILAEDEAGYEAWLAERRQGLPGQLEYRLRCKDGAELWVQGSCTPIMNERGEYKGAFAMLTDITARKRAEQERARAENRLRLLSELSLTLVAAGLAIDQITQAATRRVAELIGDICAIYFVAEDGEHFDPAVLYHTDLAAATALREADRTQQTCIRDSLSTQVIHTGEALLLPDIATTEALAGVNPKYRDYLHRYPVYSILLVPLKTGSQVAGVLSLTRLRPGHSYTEEDLRLVQELADRISLALENARLHQATKEAEERAQQQARRMVALAEVSRVMTEVADDPQSVLHTVTKYLGELLGDAVSLRLLAEDGKSLPVLSLWHNDPEALQLLRQLYTTFPATLQEHPIRTFHAGQPFFAPIMTPEEAHAITPEPYRPYVDRFGLSSSIVAPLRTRGEVIGTLSISRTTGKPSYTEEDLEFVQQMANRTATAIEKARLLAKVQEASQRKDEFLAMLGHELRNPIAAMLNAQRAAAAKQDSATMARTQEILDRQIQHMSRLVDDLLDVSRITWGKVLLQREPVHLVQLIRETCADLHELAARNGLTLNLAALDEANLPADAISPGWWVDGDRTRLAQMLTNLITNAVKFTNAGGSITVELRKTEGREEEPSETIKSVICHSPSAIVTVRDTGVGIEPQMLPHVFETFAQADRSLDRSRGGLGLGLALVKGLAELHGGTVTAQSDGIGKGTTFSFRLPLIAAPPETANNENLMARRESLAVVAEGFLSSAQQDGLPQPSLPLRRESDAGAAPKLVPTTVPRPLRILVIDDNQDSADMVCLLLQLYGYTTHAVYSGRQGLEVAEQMHPDVICCDIGLPEIDGYEIARELRRRGYDGVLIAVSGYGQEEDRRRSQTAGFNAHLVKPVEPEHLNEVLQKTLT